MSPAAARGGTVGDDGGGGGDEPTAPSVDWAAVASVLEHAVLQLHVQHGQLHIARALRVQVLDHFFSDSILLLSNSIGFTSILVDPRVLLEQSLGFT